MFDHLPVVSLLTDGIRQKYRCARQILGLGMLMATSAVSTQAARNATYGWGPRFRFLKWPTNLLDTGPVYLRRYSDRAVSDSRTGCMAISLVEKSLNVFGMSRVLIRSSERGRVRLVYLRTSISYLSSVFSVGQIRRRARRVAPRARTMYALGTTPRIAIAVPLGPRH